MTIGSDHIDSRQVLTSVQVGEQEEEELPNHSQINSELAMTNQIISRLNFVNFSDNDLTGFPTAQHSIGRV